MFPPATIALSIANCFSCSSLLLRRHHPARLWIREEFDDGSVWRPCGYDLQLREAVLKFIFGYDICLDIFASHAIGGFVDNVATTRSLHSRPSPNSTAPSRRETEIMGVDNAELAYDYVGVDAELGAHRPCTSSGPGGVGTDVAASGAVGGGREPDHIHHHHLGKEGHRDSSSEGEEEKPTA